MSSRKGKRPAPPEENATAPPEEDTPLIWKPVTAEISAGPLFALTALEQSQGERQGL